MFTELKRWVKDPIYWLVLVYVIFSITFGFIYRNGLILFLGWNIILAGFAYALANLFIYTRKKRSSIWITVILFMLFILFFPNTMYVLTDFIHLQNYTFFLDYPSVYAYVTDDWVVFTMIAIGALIAAKCGVQSLKNIKGYLFVIIKKYYFIFLGTLFVASSVGIYIGRFIRLNSWDIFKLHTYLPIIFDRFSFFISFVIMYTVIHGITYFVMTNQYQTSYNRSDNTLED
jgi:uncharacterized membrane protein